MGLGEQLEEFEPASLDEIDERASLQRRVDQKYFVDAASLARLLDEMRADHDVLEIEGDRRFDYRSVYFDGPDLRCFWDHVRGHRPRYKVRTRHYVTTGSCAFEVKVKREDEETAKHAIDYTGDTAERLTDEAWELVRETLDEAGAAVPGELTPSLTTAFERATIALRDGAERTTIDRRVQMIAGRGQRLVLGEDWALLETKTEDGRGRCDQALAAASIEPASFSKYRLGIGRLAARDDSEYSGPLMRFFSQEPAATSPRSG